MPLFTACGASLSVAGIGPIGETPAWIRREFNSAGLRQEGPRAPLSPRTLAQRLIPVRGFLRWLAERTSSCPTPGPDLELLRAQRPLAGAVLTADEAEAVLAVPDVGNPIGLRDRAILEVLYTTAIRRTELARLGVSDWARAFLMIQFGKGGKDRVVPLRQRAKAWLEACRDQVRPQLVAGRDPCVLFLSCDGRAYVQAAGIAKPDSCLLLRHTAATLMLEGDAEIRFIQALLGHESLERARYTPRSASPC